MSPFAANSGVAITTTSSAAFAALSTFLTEMEALDREAEHQAHECTVFSPCNSSTSSGDDGFFAALLAPSPDEQTALESAKRATHSIPSAPAAPVPPPKQRIRAKHAIDKLRADAEVLQHELEKLQMADKRRRLQSDSSPDASDARSSSLPPSKKLRVQRIRDNGMEQNKYLRTLVAEQQKLSRKVGNVLRRMQSKQAHSLLRSDVAVRHAPLSHADLVVFYDALTGKLDTLYTQLDNVFTDANLHSLNQQFTDSRIMISENLRATLQIRDVKVLPFNYELVHKVMWRHIQEESVQEGHPGAEEFLLPNPDEDIMLMRRALMVQLSNSDTEVEIPMRAVSKRFCAKDRMVFCWEGSADWPNSRATKDDIQGVPLRENGWAVLKRVPGTDYSTIQMCLLMTPGLSDEHMLKITSRDEVEKALEKFVLPTYRELFASRYQLVENMLFDEHNTARAAASSAAL